MANEAFRQSPQQRFIAITHEKRASLELNKLNLNQQFSDMMTMQQTPPSSDGWMSESPLDGVLVDTSALQLSPPSSPLEIGASPVRRATSPVDDGASTAVGRRSKSPPNSPSGGDRERTGRSSKDRRGSAVGDSSRSDTDERRGSHRSKRAPAASRPDTPSATPAGSFTETAAAAARQSSSGGAAVPALNLARLTAKPAKRRPRAKQMGLGVGVSGSELKLSFPAAATSASGAPVVAAAAAASRGEQTGGALGMWGHDDSEEELSEASLGEYSEPNLDTFALSSDDDNATFTPRLFPSADNIKASFEVLDTDRSLFHTPHFKPDEQQRPLSPDEAPPSAHRPLSAAATSASSSSVHLQSDGAPDDDRFEPFAPAASPPGDYVSQAMDCLLRRFADVQRELAKLRTASQQSVEIRSLHFRIAELQSENSQLAHENNLLRQKNVELQGFAERRLSISASDRGDDPTKEALRQEIKRLKNANADYVKNERAVSKLLAELGVWKERYKALEAQVSSNKKRDKS